MEYNAPGAPLPYNIHPWHIDPYLTQTIVPHCSTSSVPDVVVLSDVENILQTCCFPKYIPRRDLKKKCIPKRNEQNTETYSNRVRPAPAVRFNHELEHQETLDRYPGRRRLRSRLITRSYKRHTVPHHPSKAQAKEEDEGIGHRP